MSSIQIVQIKCPNCGGELNSVGPFSSTKVCRYCHTEIQVTGTMSKDMAVPERIILFRTNKEDFEREVLKFLVKEDYAPNDIFELAQFKDVEGIYLPMYLYEGKYECSWNCSVGYYENEVVASSDGKSVRNTKVLKYRPQSGTTKSNYAFVCLAYEGKDVKKELVDYARTFVYDSISAREFNESYLAGYNFMLHNLDKENTWSKYGISTIKYIAEQNSRNQIPGEKYKDFRCSISTDEKHNGRLVFLPFWIVYYQYNNEEHYAIMDGTGNTGLMGSVPVDSARKKAVDLWHDIAKYSKWAAIASLILILARVNIIVPIIFWLIHFGLKFYAKFNQKSIIEKNMKIRQQKFN